MASPNKITPRKLSKSLVKKHKELIKSHEEEYRILDRIPILEDKKDQLDHWINSSGASESGSKDIIKQRDSVDKELTQLRKDYEKKINPSGDMNLKERLNILKTKISQHQVSLEYWRNKNKELSKRRT